MKALSLLLVATPALLAAQGAPPAAARNLSLVRARYSGARAKEAVAWLDRFVRWPGNAGFDSSITHVAKRLADAGYVEQGAAKATDRLTYRIERYPMSRPAWEPLDATVEIASPKPGNRQGEASQPDAITP